MSVRRQSATGTTYALNPGAALPWWYPRPPGGYPDGYVPMVDLFMDGFLLGAGAYLDSEWGYEGLGADWSELLWDWHQLEADPV